MGSGLYDCVSGPGNIPLSSDINQLIDLLGAKNDGGAMRILGPIAAPSSAPTVNAGAAGALTGAYKYLGTYVSGYMKSSNALVINGETVAGVISALVSPAAQVVNLTAIPLGPTGTIARNIYRTKAGGSIYYLLYQVPDNLTTIYTDNATDASLPATVPPTVNSTGSTLQVPQILQGNTVAGALDIGMMEIFD